MTTTRETHGHEILHLLAAANPPFTRAGLAAEARSRFGAEARFCTCSADGMTLDELIVFLTSRGKIVETATGLVADIAGMCGKGKHTDH